MLKLVGQMNWKKYDRVLLNNNYTNFALLRLLTFFLPQSPTESEIFPSFFKCSRECFFLILTRGYVYFKDTKEVREKEGGKRREREAHQCGRETSIGCLPYLPQPGYVPWLGIELANFWFTGQCSNQLSNLARATVLSYIVAAQSQSKGMSFWMNS